MDPFQKNTIRKTPAFSVSEARPSETAPLSGKVLGGGLYGGTEHDEAVKVIDRAQELGIFVCRYSTALWLWSCRSSGRSIFVRGLQIEIHFVYFDKKSVVFLNAV